MYLTLDRETDLICLSLSLTWDKVQTRNKLTWIGGVAALTWHVLPPLWRNSLLQQGRFLHWFLVMGNSQVSRLGWGSGLWKKSNLQKLLSNWHHNTSLMLVAVFFSGEATLQECSDVWVLSRLKPTFLWNDQFELILHARLKKQTSSVVLSQNPSENSFEPNLDFCWSYFLWPLWNWSLWTNMESNAAVTLHFEDLAVNNYLF